MRSNPNIPFSLILYYTLQYKKKKFLTSQHPIQKLKEELLERGVDVEIIDGVIIYMTPLIQDNLVEYVYQTIPNEILDEIHEQIKDDSELWERYREVVIKINGLDLNQRLEDMWMEILNQFIRASAKSQKFITKLKELSTEQIESDELIMDLVNQIYNLNTE